MNRHYFSALALPLLLLVNAPGKAAPLQASQFADFTQYVLALSWQTGFCQSQYDKGRTPAAECLTQKEEKDPRAYLTVHGLWPSLPDSIAQHGVDDKRWRRFGCSVRPVPNMPEVKASNKCHAPSTGISPTIAAQLGQVMPGAGGSSCLERYEYAKHGVCFGFNPNDYFATMIRLNTEVKAEALGDFLQKHYGKTVSRQDFNQAVAASWGENAVKAIKLSCQGNPAYLTEMQIALYADKINLPLQADSFVAQPHPGNCGKTFILDAVGF